MHFETLVFIIFLVSIFPLENENNSFTHCLKSWIITMVRHMYKAFPNCMNNYCITVLVVKWWSTGHAINRDPLPPLRNWPIFMPLTIKILNFPFKEKSRAETSNSNNTVLTSFWKIVFTYRNWWQDDLALSCSAKWVVIFGYFYLPSY